MAKQKNKGEKVMYEVRKSSRVAECQQALARCEHDGGTILLPCCLCLGAPAIDIDLGSGGAIHETCPRCESKPGRLSPELCPCMEPFDELTILAAIKGQEERYRKLGTVACVMSESVPLRALDRATIEWQLGKLRHWCDTNQTIVLPNLPALFFLHLLDKNMIECHKLEDGRTIYVARGAKQEFYHFIHKPELSPYLDCDDIDSIAAFAYRGECFCFEPEPSITWDGRRATEKLTYIHLEERRKDGDRNEDQTKKR